MQNTHLIKDYYPKSTKNSKSSRVGRQTVWSKMGLTGTWIHAQHHKSSGKYKSTLQWELTSHLLERLLSRKKTKWNKQNKQKKNQNSKKTNPRDVLEKMWIKGKGILVGGNVNWAGTMENSTRFCKTKNWTTMWCNNSISGYFLKKIKALTRRGYMHPHFQHSNIYKS